MTRASLLTGKNNEERVGLVVATILHTLLIGWLVFKPPAMQVLPTPERMTVTLTKNVGLTSTAPASQGKPVAEVVPAIGQPALKPMQQLAPDKVSERKASPPAPTPPKASSVTPVPPPSTPASSKPRSTAAKTEAPKPATVPVSKPLTKPKPEPVESGPSPIRVRSAPPLAMNRAPQKIRPAKPASRLGSDFLKDLQAEQPTTASVRPSANPPGGGKLGNDFLKTVLSGQATGEARNAPDAAPGPAIQSALAGLISRQLKPHWMAPSGVDAEKLVTTLAWDLNRDGTLAGLPQIVRQEGITDSNRRQAARHAEQAIRAVRLAAPFDLPSEYFDTWRRVDTFHFDRKLSQ